MNVRETQTFSTRASGFLFHLGELSRQRHPVLLEPMPGLADLP